MSSTRERRVLYEYRYELRPIDKGYANRILYINLSDGTFKEKPVTQEMKDTFTGGRGFALWLLWQATRPDTKWNDSENEFIIANGPLCGILSYPGTGKSTVVTLSPATNLAFDSNGGGMFGPLLKSAGWDAIEIQGKADRDVIVVVDGKNGRVTVEEYPLEDVDSYDIAQHLTDMFASTPKEKQTVSVATTGRAADHSYMAGINLSWYDLRRKEVRYKQAARGGTGRVFRDKGMKAIVVTAPKYGVKVNNPAKPELIRKASARINKEIAELDDKQNQMRKVGTANLVTVMNDYDLLPTHNYRYGSHPEAHKINTAVWKKLFTQGMVDGCHYGCTLSCSHAVDGYQLRTGPYKGRIVTVDGPEYETAAGFGSNIGNFNPYDVLELNFYADTYGVDTISFATTMAFVIECFEEGIIDEKVTGGLKLTWGNTDAVLEVLHQLGRGEGFGAEVGKGSRYLKKLFVEKYGADPDFLNDIAMEVKGLEFSEYVTKESLAQQGGYGMANKGPQHDEAWLIFMDMVNKQLPTFEDKAEALHYFPMWRTWFSLHGMCKLPWNDIEPADNALTDEPAKVPEHVENYTWLYEGMTGKKVTGADLILQSEKVYNFQRVFNLRRGSGTRKDDRIPYRAAGPVTVDEYESRAERYDKQLKEEVGIDPTGMSTEEKLKALRKYREQRYESLMDAVYERRGWTKNGVPKLETLKRLGIDFPDVVELVNAQLEKDGDL